MGERIARDEECEREERRMLAGMDVAGGVQGMQPPAMQDDGPGNGVWQRAQRLALEVNAKGRRN